MSFPLNSIIKEKHDIYLYEPGFVFTNGSYDVICLATRKELVQILGIRHYIKMNGKEIRGIIPLEEAIVSVPNIDKNANILSKA